MKISKAKLRRIIKDELLSEAGEQKGRPGGLWDWYDDWVIAPYPFWEHEPGLETERSKEELKRWTIFRWLRKEYGVDLDRLFTAPDDWSNFIGDVLNAAQDRLSAGRNEYANFPDVAAPQLWMELVVNRWLEIPQEHQWAILGKWCDMDDAHEGSFDDEKLTGPKARVKPGIPCETETRKKWLVHPEIAKDGLRKMAYGEDRVGELGYFLHGLSKYLWEDDKSAKLEILKVTDEVAWGHLGPRVIQRPGLKRARRGREGEVIWPEQHFREKDLPKQLRRQIQYMRQRKELGGESGTYLPSSFVVCHGEEFVPDCHATYQAPKGEYNEENEWVPITPETAREIALKALVGQFLKKIDQIGDGRNRFTVWGGRWKEPAKVSIRGTKTKRSYHKDEKPKTDTSATGSSDVQTQRTQRYHRIGSGPDAGMEVGAGEHPDCDNVEKLTMVGLDGREKWYYKQACKDDEGKIRQMESKKMNIKKSELKKIINEETIRILQEVKWRECTTTLSYGCKGQKVKELQAKLGLQADGLFGGGTRKAVKKLQKEKGLKADGIVGSKTFAALDAGSGTAPEEAPAAAAAPEEAPAAAAAPEKAPEEKSGEEQYKKRTGRPSQEDYKAKCGPWPGSTEVKNAVGKTYTSRMASATGEELEQLKQEYKAELRQKLVDYKNCIEKTDMERADAGAAGAKEAHTASLAAKDKKRLADVKSRIPKYKKQIQNQKKKLKQLDREMYLKGYGTLPGSDQAVDFDKRPFDDEHAEQSEESYRRRKTKINRNILRLKAAIKKNKEILRQMDPDAAEGQPEFQKIDLGFGPETKEQFLARQRKLLKPKIEAGEVSERDLEYLATKKGYTPGPAQPLYP